MTASDGPIGIFDSGVGGLTVLKALRERIATEVLGHEPEYLEAVDIDSAAQRHLDPRFSMRDLQPNYPQITQMGLFCADLYSSV